MELADYGEVWGNALTMQYIIYARAAIAPRSIASLFLASRLENFGRTPYEHDNLCNKLWKARVAMLFG